jgi:8-oxo-dGTP diphosphatase
MKEVVVAIILANGKVLACQRRKTATYPLKWEFPGGKIEHGESPRDALVRELREELAIHAAPDGVLHVQEWNYGDAAYRVTYFLVRQYSGIPINHAFESFQWIAPSGLLDLDVLEGNRDVIEKLIALSGNEDPASLLISAIDPDPSRGA